MLIHLSYLFKHVAGSVASPLHMMRYYRSKVSIVWRQWGDSGSVFLWQNSPVLNNRLRMSPPPAVIFLHQSAQWQRANQSHYTGREREGKQSRERDRQEVWENSHQSDVTKTKGVIHRCQACREWMKASLSEKKLPSIHISYQTSYCRLIVDYSTIFIFQSYKWHTNLLSRHQLIFALLIANKQISKNSGWCFKFWFESNLCCHICELQ